MRRRRSHLRPPAFPSTSAAAGQDLTRVRESRPAELRRARLAILAVAWCELAGSAVVVAIGAVVLPAAMAYLSVASLFWLLSLAGR